MRARQAKRSQGLRSHDVSKRWDGSHRSVPSLKGFFSREMAIAGCRVVVFLDQKARLWAAAQAVFGRTGGFVCGIVRFLHW